MAIWVIDPEEGFFMFLLKTIQLLKPLKCVRMDGTYHQHIFCLELGWHKNVNDSFMGSGWKLSYCQPSLTWLSYFWCGCFWHYICNTNIRHCIVLYLFFLYSTQYLHVLKDSKRCMTHTTVQVQPNSQVTDIPLTERQRLKDDHLPTTN